MTEKSSTTEFIERLQGLVDASGKKPARISLELGLAKSTVGNYLNGNRTPTIDVTAKLADFFNVSIDWLITGKGGKQPTQAEFPLEWLKAFARRVDGLSKPQRLKLLSMIEGFLQAHDK